MPSMTPVRPRLSCYLVILWSLSCIFLVPRCLAFTTWPVEIGRRTTTLSILQTAQSPTKPHTSIRPKTQTSHQLSSLLFALHRDNSSGPTETTNLLSILQAACLIAGTTVGGGFLALPTVVAPNGFVPSATGLVGVWAYFLCTSMVVVECLIRARHSTETASYNGTITDDDERRHPGIAAAANVSFGPIGKASVVFFLVLLTEATLVSQISRAGALFPAPYRVGCLVSTLAVAGLVFGTKPTAVTSINSILTVLFCTMAGVLFGAGAPAADWSQLAASSSNWKTLPSAIPTLLQLLVYGEILPTTCQLLHYQIQPIRWAIFLGSLLPLLLEAGWAGLGIGLLGGSHSSFSKTDPVDLLLAAGPVQVPLLILATTAISTTIIGSFLALESAINDFLPSPSDNRKNSQAEDKQTDEEKPRRRTKFKMAALISLPSLAIASISPQVFLKSIDFAGSYPVLLLWGLAPTAILWKQRKSTQTQELSTSMSPIPNWWIGSLFAISVGLLGMSAAPDLVFLGSALKSVLAPKQG